MNYFIISLSFSQVVGSILAIDPDQLGTGGINYRIQSQTLCPVNSFSIGPTNGSILAVKSLNREEVSQCVLIIEVGTFLQNGYQCLI